MLSSHDSCVRAGHCAYRNNSRDLAYPRYAVAVTQIDDFDAIDLFVVDDRAETRDGVLAQATSIWFGSTNHSADQARHTIIAPIYSAHNVYNRNSFLLMDCWNSEVSCILIASRHPRCLVVNLRIEAENAAILQHNCRAVASFHGLESWAISVPDWRLTCNTLRKLGGGCRD